jgi:hypothetical protein
MAIDIGGVCVLGRAYKSYQERGMHQKHGDLAVESRVRFVFDAANFTFQWKGKEFVQHKCKCVFIRTKDWEWQ